VPKQERHRHIQTDRLPKLVAFKSTARNLWPWGLSIRDVLLDAEEGPKTKKKGASSQDWGRLVGVQVARSSLAIGWGLLCGVVDPDGTVDYEEDSRLKRPAGYHTDCSFMPGERSKKAVLSKTDTVDQPDAFPPWTTSTHLCTESSRCSSSSSLQSKRGTTQDLTQTPHGGEEIA
jgi:hypothetical protein